METNRVVDFIGGFSEVTYNPKMLRSTTIIMINMREYWYLFIHIRLIKYFIEKAQSYRFLATSCDCPTNLWVLRYQMKVPEFLYQPPDGVKLLLSIVATLLLDSRITKVSSCNQDFIERAKKLNQYGYLAKLHCIALNVNVVVCIFSHKPMSEDYGS